MRLLNKKCILRVAKNTASKLFSINKSVCLYKSLVKSAQELSILYLTWLVILEGLGVMDKQGNITVHHSTAIQVCLQDRAPTRLSN